MRIIKFVLVYNIFGENMLILHLNRNYLKNLMIISIKSHRSYNKVFRIKINTFERRINVSFNSNGSEGFYAFLIFEHIMKG